MRRLYFCLRYAWLNTVLGSEHFMMYRILGHPQRDEIAVHIRQEGGWSTHVKVSFNGNGELLQTREVPVPLNVEVVARPVSRIWFAVRDCRMTSGNSSQKLPGLLGKHLLRRIARSMNPPHFPRSFCAPGRKSVKHRKHRGNADSGAQ